MSVPIENDQIYDITVIGGGPVGLFAGFYGCMRGMRTKVIEALEELGGALTAIYPEKYIYDIAGFPRILAKDYVTAAVEQAEQMGCEFVVKTAVQSVSRNDDGVFVLETTTGTHYSRTIIISAGIGAFEPKRLDVPGVERFEHGGGVHYFAKHIEDFRDRDVLIVGGGDSAVDWANTLAPLAHSVRLVHRSKFRAHEHAISQMEIGGVQLHYPDYAVKEVHGAERLESVTFHHLKEGHEQTVDANELIVAIGFLADLGPLKTWGLEVERNTIRVDPITMATNIEGVYGCGDVVNYQAKFKLIATGVAEAITAVNHCATFINPSVRLDPGHSTNIMEKRERAAV